ncbi:MAG: helix-turn-helix transcriptional regulator [Clostridia bacterium]|nr:helix-turn-helix transcriptional regulator [Clostridia bacterium]
MEKDNFNANVDFVRGQADMIVLSALSDTDKYGLEILSAIQERSQGMYSLKQATLYSSLKRLEKNGYVHSYDGDISNGAKRVYYGLTQIGREHLENDKSYWEFCNFLMSNLISDNKFDPQNENKPFDPADFRPLTRRSRSEKEDKEQEKEVVVKYVYVKSDDIPEGADIVYVSPENVQEIENNSSAEAPRTDTQDQEMTTLSDSGNEYQPSFVLIDNERDIIDSDYDFNDAVEKNVENEVSIIETNFQLKNDSAEFEEQLQPIEENLDYQVFDSAVLSSQNDNNQPIENTENTAQDATLVEENIQTVSNVEITQEVLTDDNTPMTQDSSFTVISEENIENESITEIGIIEEAQTTELIEESITENVIEESIESAQEATPALEQPALEQSVENEDSNFADRPLRNSTDSSASFSSIFSNYARENDVNYVESFSELFDVEDEEEALEQESGADIEFLTMKEMVYKYQAKGITIKPYEKRNTMEYYVNRYYFSNKLQLHASLIIFAIFAVELFLSHFICNRGANKISDLWLLIVFALAIFPAIRGVMYIIDPTRKSLANYNPKTSILISLLPVITLPIVFALIAFVQFGANINDYSSMERTIVVPSVLLFNIPLFSLIYTLLYRTYKYHVN